jgi:hypothetical protein
MIEAKAFRTFNRIYSLFKNELLSTSIKLTLHKALIRSVMTYACPVWVLVADTWLLKLQRLKNKVLRTTGNFSRCTVVRDLHTAFNLPCVYDYITKSCRQQVEVIQNYENGHVRSIGQGKARHRKYNLAAVKLTTVQVLSCRCSISKIDMICSAKPGLTERGLVCSAQGRIFSNVLYVRYVHLPKAKLVHKRQTHPLVRENVT